MDHISINTAVLEELVTDFVALMQNELIAIVLYVDLDLEYDKVFSVIGIKAQTYEKWGNVVPFCQNLEKEGITLWKAAQFISRSIKLKLPALNYSCKVALSANEFRSAVNCSYYAIFHAQRAVLVMAEFDSSKCSGIIAYFNRHYIKTGEFDKNISRSSAITLH